jgi:predicted RNA-binding Zn-ribbon protein involved in translation (DUF1610 family)
MKHRAWNRLRAWLGGYFWLPCPICGQHFGGHEAVGADLRVVPLTSPIPQTVSYKFVCPGCTALGRGHTIEELFPA